jgi:hypothetical protein
VNVGTQRYWDNTAQARERRTKRDWHRRRRGVRVFNPGPTDIYWFRGNHGNGWIW